MNNSTTLTSPTGTHQPTPPGAKAKRSTSGTKKQIAIRLLRRAQGASLAELQRRLSWQPHSVRGFLSATARKLDGFELVSQTNKAGTRRYRLIKQVS